MRSPLAAAVCGVVVAALGAIGDLAVASNVHSPPPPATHYGYRVVASYPHDTSASTQGLLISGDRLFEGTGGYGESSVRIVELESGRVLRQRRLPPNHFGEGLALVGNRLLQLTWRSGIGYLRDAATLAHVGEFRYAGEGWGLTHHGSSLIMSNGTAELQFLDPASFAVRRTVEVRDENGPVHKLNELESVADDLYANIWQTDRIAMINPANGHVRGWLDLTGILPVVFRSPTTGVLNGIAYNPESGRLFVTGKRWARLFEIEVVAKQ